MALRVLFLRRELGEGDLDYLRSLVPRADIVAAPEDADSDGDFDVLIGARFREETVDRYPSLKYLFIPWAGVAPSDLALVRARPRLTLLNSHYNAPYVAEHAWGLLLALVKRIVVADRALRRHDWTIRYSGTGSTVLRGGTCGIFGYGSIGRELGRLAEGFGMRVLAVRRTPDGSVGGPEELPRLLGESDAVFVCVPLTPQTAGRIGAAELALLKPGAALVNIARGEVVQEEALYRAVKEGRICAAIDTWYSYPPTVEARACHPPSRLPFHELDNVVLSPHRSSSVLEADRARMRDLALALNELVEGRLPAGVVDPSRGY